MDNHPEEGPTVEERLSSLEAQNAILTKEASQASIATTAMHNIANVLNSLGTSLDSIQNIISKFDIQKFERAIDKLNELKLDSGERETHELLINYFRNLSLYHQDFKIELSKETNFLSKHIEHIKSIVHTQQNYTRKIIFTDEIDINHLLDDAIVLSAWDVTKYGIAVEKHYSTLPKVKIDKHQVLQILTNLIANSKHALIESETNNKVISLTSKQENNHILLYVKDNGVGITQEDLIKIFSHGFTTRSNGHGLGLHSCIQIAKELGGDLKVESLGKNKGALFILTLPLQRASKSY